MSKRINIQGMHRREKITGILKKKDGQYVIQTKFDRNPEPFDIPLEEFLDDFENQGVTLKVQESPWGFGMFNTTGLEERIEFADIKTHPDYNFASPAAYEKFQDMKFGMMIHWGFYSQLGVTESWCANGDITEQEFLDVYYTLWQVFNPVEFIAEDWANLAIRAGMQFFQFTTKHHDGFCMYDTKTTTMARKRHPAQGAQVGPVEDVKINYSIMDTIFRRDIVGELITAFRKKKLGIGLYYSNIDWNDPNFRWDKGSRIYDPKYGPKTHPEEWAAFIARQKMQLQEIFTNYGDIDQIFFDASWPLVALKEMEDIILMCRQLQPNCMMSDRGLGPYGDFTSPERWIPSGDEDTRLEKRPHKLWQVCDPIHGSWAYLPGDKYKSKEELLRNLIDAISKGGTYVFAVSPMPNGKFPTKTIEILEYMGDWLKLFGESIYGTRKCIKSKEPDQEIFYTKSKDSKYLYIIYLGTPPESLHIEIEKIKQESDAILLGFDEKLKWNRTEKETSIQIPPNIREKLRSLQGFAIKLTL